MSYPTPKTSFAIIMPNSHVARLQKRDFARQIDHFENPNGHFPRGRITYKYFF
jgi:hypothetical protein